MRIFLKPQLDHFKIKSMKGLILITFGILAIALIVFLVVRNQKDKSNFENKLNNDYPKSRSEDGDIEIDEMINNVH